MRFILVGTVLILVELAVLAGVIRSWGGTVLSPFLTIGMPVLFLLVEFWKGDPRDRWGVVVFATTFFVGLNRSRFQLGLWATPLIFVGSGYLVYFGLSHLGEWRHQLLWIVVSLLVVVVVFATIVLLIPFFLL